MRIPRVAPLVIALVLPATALGASISGTMSASFVSFNTFGVPTSHYTINLTCSLTCTPSAPELTFVGGQGYANFVAEPTSSPGSVGTAGVHPTGSYSRDTTNFPSGSNLSIGTTGASCYCGNAWGQGGYVDISAGVLHVPPYLQLSTTSPVAGRETSVIVNGRPRGSETLDVRIVGAGLDTTQQFTPADVGSSNSSGTALVNFTAPQAGQVTLTAVVNPGGVANSLVVTVAASTGGGAGGGSAGGGSGGGGGGDAPAGGCASAPGLEAGFAALLVMLMRRRPGVRRGVQFTDGRAVRDARPGPRGNCAAPGPTRRREAASRPPA